MLLWLPAACAAPADPAELADAADYARGVITACRVDPACPTSRDVLAEAFLAIALASAVLEGRPDPASSANARHLSPTLAARWDDLLVDGANPDPWVLQWTHTPEQPVSVEPMPEPPPRIDPQRFGGGAWLDVSASAGAGPRRLNLRNHPP